MKPPTVFLGEMTSPEVEAFLAAGHDTVIVPTGSTEQHGPHGPLLTDVLVPNEVARRVAARIGAAVAPTINYGLSYPHIGFTGLVQVRIPTFMALIEDVAVVAGDGRVHAGSCSSTATTTTRYAIAYACANGAPRLPDGVRAFPVNYWDGMTADEAGRVLRPVERAPREQGRDVGGDGDQRRPRRHRRGERRDAAVPGGRRTAPRSTPRSSSRRRAPSTARRRAARGATPASRTPSSASATSRS